MTLCNLTANVETRKNCIRGGELQTVILLLNVTGQSNQEETKHYLKWSVCRLTKAKQEFLLNREEEKLYDQVYLDRLFAWLFLRLLVEICEDGACTHMIQRENLFQFLSTKDEVATSTPIHSLPGKTFFF